MMLTQKCVIAQEWAPARSASKAIKLSAVDSKNLPLIPLARLLELALNPNWFWGLPRNWCPKPNKTILQCQNAMMRFWHPHKIPTRVTWRDLSRENNCNGGINCHTIAVLLIRTGIQVVLYIDAWEVQVAPIDLSNVIMIGAEYACASARTRSHGFW